jgi:hypothetical protein
MRFTHLFFFAAVAALALACGPASTDQEASAPDTPPGTAPDSGNYVIKTLNADLPSPRMEMTGTIDSLSITVNYGSPSVRGREVWGGLEAWDKVWRMGANECTSVTFSSDVLVEGKPLPAGRYGLFTIPREKGDWTVIFNENADQWGAYEYDEAKDVLRVDVKPQSRKANTEHLKFVLETDKDGQYLAMLWEKVALRLEIETPQE